ncbi:MAG TPA: YeeE/YedE family protein [Alphaproteobacteria bacterium]
MTAAALALPRTQRPALAAALALAAVLFGAAAMIGARNAALFVLALGIGVTLYHASFGFTGAWRRVFVAGDISGVSAQIVMLAAASLLFAPVLAHGGAFGREIAGAVAPVSVSMAFGAFLFGIGMQLGGGCASGTLYTAGGASLRMMLVLAFFCLGTFLGSLDLHRWQQLPGIGPVSLGTALGWEVALPLQLALLGAIYLALRRAGGRNVVPLWPRAGVGRRELVHGPWPLLLGAGLLALFNWLTLLIAGHAWSITWGFSLWTAKIAAALGWEPLSSPFWRGGFQQAALARPVLADTVSVMNVGILVGAFAAAALAGRIAPRLDYTPRQLLAAVIGGLAMGYGARLAYGCNIGAFFSGVASASLHGWVWILAAIPGNAIGIRLRPFFRLSR